MATHPGPGGPQQAPPAAILLQLLSGVWVTQAISVAAELGIADRLADGPKSSAELAGSTGAHAPSLYRLLRALAMVGVVAQQPDGRFALTPIGATLRSDVPGSMRALAMMIGAPWHWQSWGELRYSVRTGQSAFEQVHGLPGFQYFEERDPAAGELFAQAMTGFAQQTSAAIVGAYDCSGIGTLVDVGGGEGTLLAGLLAANPNLRGILFDLPVVVQGAPPLLAAAGVADRCQIVAGSFFETVPAGGDAYLLKNIVHGFDDDQAAGILRRCREAMRPDGRVLLVESVVPTGPEPALGKLMDLEMLVMTSGGRERTEAEYAALLQAAGFRLTRVVPTQSPVSIVEGVAAT